MDWKILQSEYLSRHPYFTARKDKCETPDGKIIEEYFVVELPVSVCAVALTKDNKVLMVRQYRHPIKETILELPGGFVDRGESPQEAMARELSEETGYTFSSLTPLGKVAANPGVLDNYTFFYLATGGEKTGEQHLDKNEDILVEEISLEELKKSLYDNRIVQSLHANCVFYALKKLGRLI